MFCLSWPFMSFEAQRKSKYAKLLQFIDSNSRLHCRCQHFLRMAVVCHYFIWALLLLFGPCRLSEFTLAGPQYNYYISSHCSDLSYGKQYEQALSIFTNTDLDSLTTCSRCTSFLCLLVIVVRFITSCDFLWFNFQLLTIPVFFWVHCKNRTFYFLR